MAKYHGLIGFADLVETEPGIWKESITERPYFGDIIRDNTQVQPTENLNDTVQINNAISIMTDEYANTHFFAMRYIIWNGVKWKVKSIEEKPPRMVINLGGLYHEE